MRRILGAAAASAALAAGMLVSTATPAAAETGPQDFVLVFAGEENGTVFASGPISGVGTDIENEAEERGTFVFPEGTVDVVHPEDPSQGSEHFNEIACVGTVSFGGTYSLEDGTGAYEDASGSGTYRGRGVFIGERIDGGCSEEGGQFFAVVRARGTTTLPD